MRYLSYVAEQQEKDHLMMKPSDPSGGARVRHLDSARSVRP